jgi:FkbM family methyltransferase
MYILPEDVDPWVSKSYRELGEYSQSEFEFLKLILNVLGCQQGPLTVIDAGAYIGDLTIPLSRLVKEVYAFEPQAEIRQVLEANLEINRISNVTVLPYALADKERPLFYNTKSTSKDGNLGGNQMQDEGDHAVEVRTLDSLQLSPHFVKADIEGMEIPMIAGGEETLARTRAAMFLEFDTVVLPEYNLLDCLRILGYNVYPRYFPVWNQFNYRKATTNPFGSTVSKMVLAVPPSGAPNI